MNKLPKNKSNYCKFYIVRHGETEWNAKGLLQGHTDIPLSETGIAQAKEIAKELKNVRFDKAYSSDLLRAQKTAEIIVLERKLAVETTKELRERMHGKYEGKPASNLEKVRKITKKLTDKQRFAYKIDEKIESDEEVVTRLITFIREVAVGNPGKIILLATHGGIMRAFLIHLGIGTYKNLSAYSIKNTAYIQLRSDGIDFFVDKTKGIEGFEK